MHALACSMLHRNRPRSYRPMLLQPVLNAQQNTSIVRIQHHHVPEIRQDQPFHTKAFGRFLDIRRLMIRSSAPPSTRAGKPDNAEGVNSPTSSRSKMARMDSGWKRLPHCMICSSDMSLLNSSFLTFSACG